MAINPNNGVLNIINGTLKVSSIDIKQAGGFTTAINTVARNDVLLFDDQKSTTTFLPTVQGGYMSSTGVTRDTTVGSGYLELGTTSDAGWVYWPLQLPNAWHAEFDMLVTATGGALAFSLFNTSEPNHTNHTNNDGGYKIVFDNTNNQIVIYWEGSVHKTVSASVRSSDWQSVNINYFLGAISVSLAGNVVLTHEFTENYQEFDSRYIGFSATAGTSHKIRHLRIHNSDKWIYTKTSNASDIAYVSGNVGIGSLSPTELLDVHGNVHIAKDLTVDGNIIVSGATTIIDSTNLAVEDPIIELAKGNAVDTIDSGLIVTRNTSNVAIAFRGDEEELALGYTQSGASSADVTPIANGGLDVRVYGNLFANNLTTTANVEAAYLKGDGSYLTGLVTDLQSVADNGNTCSNTIQLTNTDVGLKATGNVEANYFVGDGSKLTNMSTTLQAISDNGNVTSNTIQFTNATTAFITNSNVGIGTATPSANLHVAGYQYVNDPPTLSNSFDHTDAPLTLTHGTATSDTAINDPKPILHLTRDGTTSQSYGARASFNLSRYENSSTHSRSRLDVALADGTYAESNVMTLRSDGSIGIRTTVPAATLDIRGAVADPNTPTVHIGDNVADAGDYGMVNLVRDGTNGGSKSHLAFIRNRHTVVGMGFHNNTNTWGIFPSFSGITTTPGLAITPDSKVGIGTATMDAPLHIFKDGGNAGQLGGGIIMERNSNYGCAIWSQFPSGGTVDCMNFRCVNNASDAYGGTPQMVLTHQGHIGMGVTDPDTRLTVSVGAITASTEVAKFHSNYDSANNGFLIIEENNHTPGNNDWTGYGTKIQKKVDSTYQGYIEFNPVGGQYSTAFGMGGSEYMRLEYPDGNLGIGTTNPLAKLDVRGAIVAPVVSYAGNQNAAYLIPAATSYTGAATNWGTYGFQHRIKTDSGGNPRITIDDGNANEVFTIRNGGNIGIGTNSPEDKLDIRHGTGGNEVSVQVRSGGLFIRRHDTGGQTAYPLIQTDFGMRRPRIMMTDTGNTQRVFISGDNNDFTFFKAGNIGIGTASALPGPTAVLNVAGHAIFQSRVMCNQPRFFAWSNSGSISFSGGATINLTSTAYNSGSHYSTSTGYFTAPVNGVYHFTVGVFTYTSMQFSWKIIPTAGSLSSNNAHVSRNNGTGDDLLILSAGASGQYSGSITLFLYSGEQFGWGSRSQSGSYYGAHSHFSGYLLSQV